MGQKITAFLVAFALILSAGVFSATAGNSELEVNYRIPTDMIDIVLSGSEADEANIVITDEESFDINSNFVLLKELTKGTDGAFKYSAAMPDLVGSGKYFVTVKTDTDEVLKDSFWYMSEVQATEALQELSLATEQNFASLIGTYQEDLGIDIGLFNAGSERITEAFFKFKPNGRLNKKSFLTVYAYACLFGNSTDESDIEKIRATLELESGHIGFDLSNFKALEDSAQEEVLNRLKAGSYDNKDPQTLLKEWISLADINNTSVNTVDNFKNLLFNKHKDVLQLDMAAYNASSQKNTIISDVINGVPYSSVNALRKAFVEIAKKYPYISAPGSGSGGSGGGKHSVQISYGATPDSQNQGSAEFSDVSTVYWAYNPIKVLYQKGIITGKAAKKFFPEDNVTRAEFSKIIAQAFFADSTIGDLNFNDVAAGAWYYEPVMKLAGLGIILGDPDGSFRPDEHITRQDAAVVIRRVCEQKGISLETAREYIAFMDHYTIDGYATEAVEALYTAGIINGMSDSTFAPLSSLTRAQAVQLVYTSMQKIEEGVND